MNRDIITICVDKNTTQGDLKTIREQFKKDNPNCKLNVIVSGNQDVKEMLINFIKARTNP